MNYYDDQTLIEEIYDRLFSELGRDPSQDEIDNELFKLEQYEPDFDDMLKDNK